VIDRSLVQGKRICALDVGMRRIGVAVCDELHITVSTRPVIENDPETVWTTLQRRLDDDRIGALVVGVPLTHDDRETEIIQAIRAFIAELRQRTDLPVFEVDEAFSTQRAREVMNQMMKKGRRQQKGTKDVVAAAVILRDVLEELR
jgi:putative Holliday junction resolvase